MTQHGMTARAYDRILKVARTVADLEGAPGIEPKRIAEAIQYKTLDRTFWARQVSWGRSPSSASIQSQKAAGGAPAPHDLTTPALGLTIPP
jgi:hypothetical protein